MKLIERFVMWYLHRQYVKNGHDIMTIRGTFQDFPKYLKYTEKPRVYIDWDLERMEAKLKRRASYDEIPDSK